MFFESLKDVVKKNISAVSPLDPLIYLHLSLLPKFPSHPIVNLSFRFAFIVRIDIQYDVIILARLLDKFTW